MDPVTKTTDTPLPGQGAQPPATLATPPAQPPAKPTQSEYISRDEAQQLADQAAEKAFKRSQALITKSNERIRAEVTRLETLQTKAGLPPLTPEQREKITDQVREEVLTEPSPTAMPGHGVADEDLDPVNKIATSMMNEAGVLILEEDPEFKTLSETKDPYIFIKELAKAIEAKRARTSTQAEKSKAAAIHNPGLGTGAQPPPEVRPGQGYEVLGEYFAEKGLP